MNCELVEQLRKTVDARLAQRAAAKLERAAAKVELVAAGEHEQAVREATVAAQETAKAVQEHAHRQIATVVSRALEAVFDEPYQFKVIFEQKRGKTEASLVFERGGVVVDPMSAAGGGVVDVAAFALRLSCLLLQRPPVRRLLVLDEPFKHLSREYVGRARALLETLAAECDFQIVMVTHLEELACGTVVRL